MARGEEEPEVTERTGSVISKWAQRRLKLRLWSEELVWIEMALTCLFSGHLQFALGFFFAVSLWRSHFLGLPA